MGLYIAPMLSKPDMVKPVNPTGGRWHMLEIQHDSGACSVTSALEQAYGATSAASRCQVKFARYYWSGYAMLSTSFLDSPSSVVFQPAPKSSPRSCIQNHPENNQTSDISHQWSIIHSAKCRNATKTLKIWRRVKDASMKSEKLSPSESTKLATISLGTFQWTRQIPFVCLR